MYPLDVLRAELVRYGLPWRYVDRACAEIAAHLDDAEADIASEGVPREAAQSMAAQRLGDPGALATSLFEQRRASSIWLRAPVPMTLTVALTVFLMLGSVQLAVLAALWRSLSPEFLEGLQVAAKIALPVFGSGILFHWITWHTGKRRWVALACIALLVLSLTSDVRLRRLSHDHAVATLHLIPYAGIAPEK